MTTQSLLSYYQEHNFNPVPITVEDQAAWESHFAKRLNLYQRHLGIPLSLLRDRSVLEFGCCSGENALVPASVGANLTLVEPNEQVLPRLRTLFRKFGLEERIATLVQEDIASFEPRTLYDVVLAEGFLFTLPNRDEMVQKIGSLLVPGGLAVISLNDRYGGLLEMTRRMILWRACQLAAVDDVHSEDSLELARRLYWQDFAQLNASRPFEVWWRDSLVNPLFSCFWSYPELVPLIERAGCEFYSSSPKWASLDHFAWYKNVPDSKDRHARLLDDWARVFPYFLTGLPPVGREAQAAPREVIDAVADLVAWVSEYTREYSGPLDSLVYPPALDKYLASLGDPALTEFNADLKRLYETAVSGRLDDLLRVYHGTSTRNLWGTPYHYICFSKLA